MENEWTRKVEQLKAENEELKKYKEMWEVVFETTHDGGHEFENSDVRHHVGSLMKKTKRKFFPEEGKKVEE